MTISYHKGDIFETECQAIAHGVNLVHCQDHGLAASVWEKYPEAHRQYENALKHNDLGPGEILPVSVGERDWIVNIATQEQPGAHAEIELLRSGVAIAMEWADFNKIEGIAFPAIGSGIGGLKIRDSLMVLETEAQNHPNLLVEIWTN